MKLIGSKNVVGYIHRPNCVNDRKGKVIPFQKLKRKSCEVKFGERGMTRQTPL